MTRRIRTFLMGLFALLITFLLAFTPVGAKPVSASGGNAWLSFGLNTLADAAISGEDIRAEKREKSSKFLGGLFSSSSTKEDVLSDMQGVVTKTTGDVDLSAVQGSVLLQGGDYTGVGGKVNVTAKQTYLQGVVDSQYSFEQSNDNNGFVITDKTRVTVNETADAPRFNDGALTINGDLHVGGRDGSPQLVRGGQIETLGPQGILAAQNAGESSGEGSAGGEHWTKGFTDQYGGDANIRQVALTDVTGPGTGYLNDLNAVAKGDVTYGDKAELLDVDFAETTRQAGVLTKAAIALITQNPWNAFFLNTAADAAISGEVNLKNIVKDAAFTAIGGGFEIGNTSFAGTDALVSDWVGGFGLADAGYFSPEKLATIGAQGILNGSTQTAFYGGSLGDNIRDNFSNALVNEATAFGQNQIAGIKKDLQLGEGSLPGALLHGALGCASSEAGGGDCAAGFATGSGAEFATGILHRATDRNEVKAASLAIKYANPVLAALASGGDVGQFGLNKGIADSKIDNNYLSAKKGEIQEFARRIAACENEASPRSCREEVIEWAKPLSDANYADMQRCGDDWQCLNKHFDDIKEGEYQRLMLNLTPLTDTSTGSEMTYRLREEIEKESRIYQLENYNYAQFGGANCSGLSNGQCATYYDNRFYNDEMVATWAKEMKDVFGYNFFVDDDGNVVVVKNATDAITGLKEIGLANLAADSESIAKYLKASGKILGATGEVLTEMASKDGITKRDAARVAGGLAASGPGGVAGAKACYKGGPYFAAACGVGLGLLSGNTGAMLSGMTYDLLTYENEKPK